MSDTKGDAVIELLTREGGATVKEIVAATGWKDVSARGFISGTVKGKLGYNVASVKTDGVRRYTATKGEPPIEQTVETTVAAAA